MPGALMLYFMNGSPVKFGNAEFCAEDVRTVVKSRLMIWNAFWGKVQNRS